MIFSSIVDQQIKTWNPALQKWTKMERNSQVCVRIPDLNTFTHFLFKDLLMRNTCNSDFTTFKGYYF